MIPKFNDCRVVNYMIWSILHSTTHFFNHYLSSCDITLPCKWVPCPGGCSWLLDLCGRMPSWRDRPCLKLFALKISITAIPTSLYFDCCRQSYLNQHYYNNNWQNDSAMILTLSLCYSVWLIYTIVMQYASSHVQYHTILLHKILVWNLILIKGTKLVPSIIYLSLALHIDNLFASLSLYTMNIKLIIMQL